MAGAVVEMPTARIRVGAWYDDREVELSFPSGWEVETCAPAGARDIGAAGVAEAFAHPVGTAPLRHLARGRHAPCVVVDDLTRPTQGRRLVPAVLDELEAAGIAAADVHVLVGVANHRPLTREDLVKKLGPEVLARCRVSSHFSWAGCQPIGETGRGTPVELNAEFLRADLRILVGSIIPHAATGFSGGAKLLMPGIASITSAEAFHRGSALEGDFGHEESPARLEAEEAARLARVDFIVNSVPTPEMGVAGVVVGDVVGAHRAGVDIARKVFATSAEPGADACVLSLYPKDSEFLQHVTAFAPYRTSPEPLVRRGGSVVVALAGSEGLGFHSLFGPGMALAAPAATRLSGRGLAFFCPNLDRGELAPEVAGDTTLFNRWVDTVAWLEARHAGTARVSVFPCATIQLVAGRPGGR
ncbi:MAG TPA: lactate racemase domain-containing protein [Acidimicrobiales bacterium]|nr:lactate racemase domain-containing protein [Acidimicrobiales bacterium]